MSTAIGQQIPTLFRPSQISGCQLWLDGADPAGTGVLPANGGTVSTWTDKSGNSKNATSATGTPTYSLSTKSVAFNGSTYYSLPNSTLPTGNGYYSIFLIVSSTLADYQWIIGQGTTSGGGAVDVVYYPNGTVENGWWSLNITTPAATVLANQPNLIGAIYNSSSLTTFVNGTSKATSSSLGTRNSAAGPAIIGARIDSSTGSIIQPLIGNLYECIVFNSGLSTLQQQQLEGYLAWKWGLQASLPSTHAYSSSPVYQLPPFPLVPRVANATSFLPLDPRRISGCSLWLDAADSNSLILSGTNVTQWNDKSGNNRNLTQATAGSRPIVVPNAVNTNSVVSFTGTTFLNGNLPVNGLTNMSVFFVEKPGRNLVGRDTEFPLMQWGETAGWGFVYFVDTQQRINWRFGTGQSANQPTYTNPSPSNTYRILGFTKNGTSEALFFNGEQVSSYTAANTTLANNLDAFRIAYDPYYPSFGIYDIGEIVIFTTALTTLQRQQIEGYLAWKWGLVSSLPSTHPYKIPLAPFSYGVRQAVVKSFRPTNISGCQVWLDAKDPTIDGTLPAEGASIASWKDKSGNGYDLTQATSGNRPTFNTVNSMGMINFIRANKTYLINTTLKPLMTNFTLFIIAQRKTIPSDTERLFVAIPVSYATDWNTTTGLSFSTTLEIAANGSGTTYADSSNLALNLYTINAASNTAKLYKNGGSSALITHNLGITGNSIGILLGSGTNGGINTLSEQFNGYMGEVVLFTTSLTLGRQHQIEGYLAWKWKLQANLPSTHPYKLFPPPPQ